MFDPLSVTSTPTLTPRWSPSTRSTPVLSRCTSTPVSDLDLELLRGEVDGKPRWSCFSGGNKSALTLSDYDDTSEADSGFHSLSLPRSHKRSQVTPGSQQRSQICPGSSNSNGRSPFKITFDYTEGSEYEFTTNLSTPEITKRSQKVTQRSPEVNEWSLKVEEIAPEVTEPSKNVSQSLPELSERSPKVSPRSCEVTERSGMLTRSACKKNRDRRNSNLAQFNDNFDAANLECHLLGSSTERSNVAKSESCGPFLRRDLCRSAAEIDAELDKSSRHLVRKNIRYRPLPFDGFLTVDVIRHLRRMDLTHILTSIFSHLSDKDLAVIGAVSTVWRNAVYEDKDAMKRREQFLRHVKLNRENLPEVGTRLAPGTPRKAMSNRSNRLSNSPSYTKRDREEELDKNSVSPSKFRLNLFMQEASKLNPGEQLRSCPRCTSPSRVIPAESAAQCSRSSCKFHFCTLCMCEVHMQGGRCRRVTTQNRAGGGTVVSKKAKKWM